MFLALYLASGICLASANSTPLAVSDNTEIVLGKHLVFLEDVQGTLLLEDILRPEYQQRFEPVFVDTPYFGRSHSTFWFRLQLLFPANSSNRILEVAYPHLKSITLYELSGDQAVRVVQSGYSHVRENISSCLRFCFVIPGNKGIHTLYFKVATDSPLFLPMTLRSPEQQLLSERITMGTAALFYGAFVVMALFNLFVFFSTQERSYLVYVLYILSLVIWTSSHDGLLREIVLNQNSVMASYTTHFLITLMPVVFGALFCQHFLKTALLMPLHHKVFSFLIVLSGFNVILVLVTGRIVLPNSVNILTVTFSVAGVSASCLGLYQGLKTARFFLTAWIAVIVGSVAWVLTLSGVLPFNPLTGFSVHIGALMETILLSLALGDRINVLQAERIQVEQDANRSLEESNQKLEASNRFKDEFLSTISHELRTPMNGIFGAAELLENTRLESEQFKYLSTIHRSSREMLAMVENILTYTQFEAGTAAPSIQPIRIRALLDELAAHYRGRSAIQQLEFRYHIDPTIPEYLAGDMDKLRLLLDHLLDNACKFTDTGQIRFDITLDTRQDDDQQTWLKFIIKDTGCGVPESLQGEIFNSFKQADGSMTRRKGGLGIGLALCKRIVDILDGRLMFNSAVQQGTTVVLSLPFASSNAVYEPPRHQIDTRIDCAQIDILVVEDNYVNKLVLEGFLKKMGFNVFAADNGKEAITLLEKRNFDLIFMDCQMPVMDGFEAARRTRGLDNRNARIPIIAVTANANPGDRERCLEAGMNDYLKKPFNQVTLTITLNRWLAPEKETSMPGSISG